MFNFDLGTILTDRVPSANHARLAAARSHRNARSVLRCALSIVSLGSAATLSGQTAPARATPGPVANERALGGGVTLIGPMAATPRQVPSLHGLLSLDPTRMIAVPTTAGASAPRGLPDVAASGWFIQEVRDTPEGLTLTPPRAVNGAPARSAASCRALAERFVQRLALPDGIEEWRSAVVASDATPMLRPDVDGVAYYEFAVTPRGFVIVATGAHDDAIPHWSFLSRPVSQRLQEQAGAAAISALYRVDAGCYVAEGAGDRIVAQLGSLPSRATGSVSPEGAAVASRPFASWRELKTDYATTFAVPLAHLRREALVSASKFDRLQPAGPLASTTELRFWFAGTEADQRLYTQFTTGSCASFSCLSGCGPTAWAMLLGWIDGRARGMVDGRAVPRDTRFAGCERLFPYPAPQRNTCLIEQIVAGIRWSVSTFCMGSGGATHPIKMGDVNEYLRPRGYPASAYDQKNIAGINENMIRDHAIAAIQGGKPAVIGTGWLTHYPLAHGYHAMKFLENGVEVDRLDFFFVNQGWGGQTEAVLAKTWFAGSIVPGRHLQTQLERCRCTDLVYYLGSDNVWRSVRRDGRPVVVPVSGGRVRWYCCGSYEWSYFDAAATRLEVSFPDTYPTGLLIEQAVR